jgi:hypothetical protein
MSAHFDTLRILRVLSLDGPVSPKEGDDVESDQGERDDGPATPLHVFVAERDEQHDGSFRVENPGRYPRLLSV